MAGSDREWVREKQFTMSSHQRSGRTALRRRILLASTFLLWAACGGLTAVAAVPRQVFAHYMVCFATYGASVQGYQREIREAQDAGIDGFALNVGAWSGPDTYYRQRVPLIFEAAERLGTGFKLFFSVEITNETDIVEMISTYAPRPNSFRSGGKWVVSTYGQNDIPSRSQAGVNWTGRVLPELASRGIPVRFVPHFWPDPVQELPSYNDGRKLYAKYGSWVDGLFLFGAAGLPAQLAQCNSNHIRAAREAGKISMAGVSPHYWGCNQNSSGRRYFEYDGGEGLALQWEFLLNHAPDWVELVTWNDWNESTYMAPIDDPGRYFEGVRTPRRHSHAGYLELSRRFIQQFKTGTDPMADRDALYFFYRTHPAAALASARGEVRVGWVIGKMEDVVHVTVHAVSPAELVVSSGGRVTTNQVQSGLSHVRIPFLPGAQSMLLRRDGAEMLRAEGPAIQSQVRSYNFFPATGFAYGPPPGGGRL